MLANLADADVPCVRTQIWQVDERVAPDGHPDRNMSGLLAVLPAAAARYAAELPDAFDVVHLGLGIDGHTASLVPGDPALDVSDRDVAVTGEYRGRRRMTFTYPVLDRVAFVLWLVTGADKAAMLPRLLGSDRSIPAGRSARLDSS